MLLSEKFQTKLHAKTCIQCNQAESKYTCPACSVRTCSLGCSNQHKLDRKCTGKRNRVEYVQLNQYSWGRLMQDYSYLEEIHRHLSRPDHPQSADPSAPKLPPLRDLHPTRNASSKRQFLVRKAALEGVRLTLMPDGMSRRKINTTHFNQKKQCLQWSVELIFPAREQDNKEPESNNGPSSSHLIHQIPSDTTMVELLRRTLNLKKLKLSQDKRTLLSTLMAQQELKEEEDSLMFIVRIEPVMRHETAISSTPLQEEVHVIEATSTLSAALNGTSVVEWPKIEVWAAAEWTAEISSGRVRIVPRAIPLTGSQRPVDSGWPAKRPRTEPSEHPPSDIDDDYLDLENQPEAAGEGPQKPLLTSLLQYSSSEEEPDGS